MEKYVSELVKEAKKNSYLLSRLGSSAKNDILLKMADLLIERKDFILKENEKDVYSAREAGVKKSFVDRLTLSSERIQEMSYSLKALIGLTDPLEKVLKGWSLPNGLCLQKVSVPIGVILIIYEARPNVTSDCIGLCFKTSNVAILRGGRNALLSNKAIFNVLSESVRFYNIGYAPFFFVDRPSHEAVDILLKEKEYIDLVIPRGGEELIRKVTSNSSIPVIKHYKGVCHIFVDRDADLEKAIPVCVNAKCQRPSVCNAVETILVHKEIAEKFLPRLQKYYSQHKVLIKGDAVTCEIIKGIEVAHEDDWSTEYLDLVVSVRVVDNIDEAVKHINFYGSHHTDSILTENIHHARKFTREVDSACCFVNISTRFSDGYQFGLGAEIGVSTDKLHARGPMGLEELTTYKYIVEGDGHVRV